MNGRTFSPNPRKRGKSHHYHQAAEIPRRVKGEMEETARFISQTGQLAGVACEQQAEEH